MKNPHLFGSSEHLKTLQENGLEAYEALVLISDCRYLNMPIFWGTARQDHPEEVAVIEKKLQEAVEILFQVHDRPSLNQYYRYWGQEAKEWYSMYTHSDLFKSVSPWSSVEYRNRAFDADMYNTENEELYALHINALCSFLDRMEKYNFKWDEVEEIVDEIRDGLTLSILQEDHNLAKDLNWVDVKSMMESLLEEQQVLALTCNVSLHNQKTQTLYLCALMRELRKQCFKINEIMNTSESNHLGLGLNGFLSLKMGFVEPEKSKCIGYFEHHGGKGAITTNSEKPWNALVHEWFHGLDQKIYIDIKNSGWIKSEKKNKLKRFGVGAKNLKGLSSSFKEQNREREMFSHLQPKDLKEFTPVQIKDLVFQVKKLLEDTAFLPNEDSKEEVSLHRCSWIESCEQLIHFFHHNIEYLKNNEHDEMTSILFEWFDMSWKDWNNMSLFNRVRLFEENNSNQISPKSSKEWSVDKMYVKIILTLNLIKKVQEDLKQNKIPANGLWPTEAIRRHDKTYPIHGFLRDRCLYLQKPQERLAYMFESLGKHSGENLEEYHKGELYYALPHEKEHQLKCWGEMSQSIQAALPYLASFKNTSKAQMSVPCFKGASLGK